MRISKALRLCIAMFSCLYAQFSAAQDVFYLGYEQGEFEIEQTDYREIGVSSLSIGASNSEYTLQLSAYKFDDVKADTANIIDAADREIEGYGLQLGKTFRVFKILELEVNYGRFWWETRDILNNVRIDEQSGADRLLEAGLSVNIGQVGLYVGRKQMRDVAGSDLDVTVLGARYYFK
ncbi:MAG TPA: hypothetical protein VF268_16585 [Gammaproteobacteria bacterium]